MKLILTVASQKDRIEAETALFHIRMSDSAFCLPVPDYDDWLGTENFDLGKAEAILKSTAPEFTIEFPDNLRRTFFLEWLKEANAKAAKGAKTMWP
jgi:hypothetical protein